jgi:hypothetical protein
MYKSHTGAGRRVLTSILLFSCLNILIKEPYQVIPAAFAQSSPESTDVFFNLNEHGIQPDNASGLNDYVAVLKNDPGLVIVVDGYSDITGEDQYNLNLSRLRAEAVKEYYVSHGIESERIKSHGNGKTDKFDSGIDEESLKRNRRVRVTIEPSSRPKPASTPSPGQVASRGTPAPAIEPEPLEESPPEVAQPDTAREKPVQEPQAPSITELSTPPPDLERAIGHSMRKLAPGLVVFDAPAEMNVGESYEVEVDLPYSFLKGLSDSINDMRAQGFNKIRLGQNVGLSLNGRGFDIRPVTKAEGEEEQFPVDDTGITMLVTENSTPVWKWKVTPLKSGYKSLLLSIEVMAEDAEYNEMVNEYPLFQKVIEVKSNFLYTLTRSYWMMALFMVIVVAVVGWILIKKMRVG